MATPLVIVAAKRTGIVDRPGALKPQTDPVPYLGGVAVFAGTAVGAAVGRPTVMVPLAAALCLGVADDRFDLPAQGAWSAKPWSGRRGGDLPGPPAGSPGRRCWCRPSPSW